MKNCNITVKDEVYCHISGLYPPDQEFLENKFSILIEGAYFNPKVRLGQWDGKIKFFDKLGKIYSRLLPDVLPYIENWGYNINLQDFRAPVPLISTRIDKDWFLNKPDIQVKINLRPYQVDAVNACLDATSGFCEMSTGCGKTLATAALADVMVLNGTKTIVIVPSADLVEQTANTFRLCTLDVGVYSGIEKDFNHPIVVGTWQSLQNNPGLMREGISCVIVDESHGCRANVMGKLINTYGNHIPFRFGFTGTMPKALIDQMTLKGSIGDVIFEYSAAQAIKDGYLAKLQIEPVEIESDSEEFPDYASEKAFLGRSSDRLDFIADLIISKAQEHGNTLVLVNSIKQGKLLQKRIKDSVFLYGASENDVRAEWYSTFETRDDLIVIASAGIASVGISIDRIFCGFMIDGGKSFIRSIQGIGRSLRKGRDKDHVHLVDVYSKLKWSRKHFKDRAKFYKDAQYPMLKTVKVKL